jgi:dihydrofolate synthase/folylpolyglutamate synthase
MLTYEAALQAIFQRTDYERSDQPPYPERVWRLARMESFLAGFGHPDRAYRSVHIAGTKGKGSTTAMIESILRAAGYRTGMYTSPHLHTFRERIRLQAEPIPEEAMTRLVERMLPAMEANPDVTVFEIITTLAMLYFAEEGVDWGVFEVGMGGRLDATNVLRPEVSVITSISMDHMKVLGDTLEAIAGEKAGIIKAGIPVVSAPQRPVAMEVVRETAAERGTSLVVAGEDWRWRFLETHLSGQRFDIYRAGREAKPDYASLRLPLLGAHQMENACTAVAAITVLRERGAKIHPQAVHRGLAAVQWPGRLEVLGRRPFVVVDGAHNANSMDKLVEALPSYLHYRQLIVIFGAGTTHDPRLFLPPILDKADSLIMTRSRHAKATPVDDLLAIVRSLGHEATPSSTVADALAQALEQARPDDLVLVTGSLFVVAEAREAWTIRQGLPPLPSDPPGVYEPRMPAAPTPPAVEPLQPDDAR